MDAIPSVPRAAITVDARREAAWDDAARLEEPFATFQPTQRQAPAGTTEAWILADSEALYVYFVATQPGPTFAGRGRRDSRPTDDFVGLYLDPSGAGQRAYQFTVNPVGVQGDGVRLAGAPSTDTSWDSRWTSAARTTATGYEVELAIPWRSVRHPREVDQVGVILVRNIARLAEKSSWPALDPAVSGLLLQEARLDGPGRLPRDPGIDLMPELTWRETSGSRAEGSLEWHGVSPGLTIRYRPAPAVSLLATLNPDFSQVESDAAQIDVNRRNSLYFEEKRRFFLDGQEWFDHPLGEVVYTRAMIAPIGGARITAEAGGTTVAALSVVDTAPGPTISEGGGWVAGDLRGRDAVETVVRARQDVGRDGFLGLLVSDRTVLQTDLANRVVLADAALRLSPSTRTTASAGASWTSFADRAPALAPAGSVAVDHAGAVWFASTRLQAFAPGFRAENGYFPLQDLWGGASELGLARSTGARAVRRWTFTPAAATYGWTFDGRLREASLGNELSLALGNGGTVAAGVSGGGERYAERWLPTGRVQGSAFVPLTGAFSVEAGGDWGQAPYYDPADPHVGREANAALAFGLRPLRAWTIELSGAWSRFADPDGVVRYDGAVGRAQSELFVSNALFGRWILDFSTLDHLVSQEALLGWEESPGTALYLGGTLSGAAWTVFAKASVTFSP